MLPSDWIGACACAITPQPWPGQAISITRTLVTQPTVANPGAAPNRKWAQRISD